MQKNGAASIAIAIIVALVTLGSVATYSLTHHFFPKEITTVQNEPGIAQPGDKPSPVPLAANNHGQTLPSAATKPSSDPQTESSVQQPIPSNTEDAPEQNPNTGTVQALPPSLITPPPAITQPTIVQNFTATATSPSMIATTAPFNMLPLGAIQLFKCGDPVSFTYRNANVTYGTAKSPVTGACWLDRNLGAARVAQNINDSQGYGDLFEWGRPSDGHQSRTSATTTVRSTTDVPGHNKFIVADDLPYDWQTTPNTSLWQGINGKNNPCPLGWRIPTKEEWAAEQPKIDFLKLTTGGGRNGNYHGMLIGAGSYGHYWSSTPLNASILVWNLYINHENTTSMTYSAKDGGFSVRCIKN